MPDATPAILGTVIVGARSFAFAFNGSAGAAVNKAVAKGSYVLRADYPFWIKNALTSGLTDVAVPGTSQPAVGSENSTVFVGAETDYPLDVPADAMSISILGGTTTGGTLRVSGPYQTSVNR